MRDGLKSDFLVHFNTKLTNYITCGTLTATMNMKGFCNAGQGTSENLHDKIEHLSHGPITDTSFLILNLLNSYHADNICFFRNYTLLFMTLYLLSFINPFRYITTGYKNCQ
jgi:hypothetical protein